MAEVAAAGVRAGLFLLAFTPLALRSGNPSFGNRAGDLAFVLFVALGFGALGYFEEREARSSVSARNPWSPGVLSGVGWAVLIPAFGLQALYCAAVFETRSLGAAFEGALGYADQLDQVGMELFGFWLAVMLPTAVGLLLRFGFFPLRQKVFYAAAAGAWVLSVCALAVVSDLSTSWEDPLVFKGWTHLPLTLGVGLLAFAAVPALAVVQAVRTGEPHPQHGAEPHAASGLMFGVVIPLLAFAFNEISGDFGPAEGPRWAKPEFGTWIKLLLTPEVQRPLYPLLGFCVAAYFAAVYQRRRAPWITAGLGCGVVLSALFCVVYGLTIPFSVVLLVVFGLGLLGLSPLIVFVLYSQAWFHDRVPPHDPAPRRRWLAGVGAALGYSLWRVAVRTAEAHARLPVEPPDDCYVATATARAARWAGAEVVTFPGGRQAPVSRQLRVLKAAEQVIAHAAPRTHWALRVVYDRVGPPIAHRLGPRSGALAWLLLLPAQWASECALRLLGADLERLLTRVYPEADSTGPGGA